MAEIGILPNRSFAVPIQQFQAPRIDTTPPPPPPIDMSGAARAAMIAQVASTLAGLPGQIQAGLQKQRQEKLEMEGANARTELIKAQTEYYKNRDTTGAKPSAGLDYYKQLTGTFENPLAGPMMPPTPMGMAEPINPDVTALSGGVVLPANGEQSMIPVAPLDLDPSLPLPSGSATGALGKVTSYGYANDSTPDANSSAGIGAWVPDSEQAKIKRGEFSPFRLQPGDIAVSPDIEEQFKASGISPGDMVSVTLADGTTRQGRWMDRTAQDKDVLSGRIKGVTQPLRGRFDFYSPNGVDPLDGQPVVGFAPASTQAAAPPTQMTIDGQGFDIPASALSAGPGAPAPVVPTGPVAQPFSLDVTAPGQQLPTPQLPAIPEAINPDVNPASKPIPVRRPTMARDPQSGIITVQSPGGSRYEVLPTGAIRQAPAAPVDKAPEGMNFPSMEAAEAKLGKGAVQKAKLNPDGTVTVDEVVTPGSDIKGRGKLTDSTRNQLTSSITLANDMDGLVETHQKLYSDNKAGPIAGRLQQGLAKLGWGEGEYVGTQGKIEVGNFRIARLLNGPGVLTKNDLDRAQKVAPTLNETPESFAAKMNTVRGSLLESIQTWKAANGAAATEEQLFLADEGIKKLQSEMGKTPAPAAATAAPTDENSEAVAWLSANPDHPKAASVRAALRAKGVQVP